MNLEIIIIIVVISVLLIIIIAIIAIKCYQSKRQQRLRQEIAEEEMRVLNYEHNRKRKEEDTINLEGDAESSGKMYWEFSLTSENYTKIQVTNRINIIFLSMCSLQTQLPLLPISHCNYFEIFFLKLDENAKPFIGLAAKQKNLECIPGEEKESFGLSISEGVILKEGKKSSKKEIERIESGDIIGCFYNPFKQLFYFTYNGLPLKKHKFVTNQLRLYPTIYANPSCKIQYNFGAVPFAFKLANSLHYGIASHSVYDITPPEYLRFNNHASFDV